MCRYRIDDACIVRIEIDDNGVKFYFADKVNFPCRVQDFPPDSDAARWFGDIEEMLVEWNNGG